MFTRSVKKLSAVVATFCFAAVLLGASKPAPAGGAGSKAANAPSTGPIGNLRPQGLVFFTQVGQASFSQPVRLFNGGNTTMTHIVISVSGPYSQTSNCKATIAAGADCILQITFTPTATGVQTGTLTIKDNAADSPQTVTLVGTGVAAPVFFNPPSGLSFGTEILGRSKGAMSVAVTNTGAAALTVSSVVASGDFSETNDCASLVGVSCVIRVSFNPTALGTRTGTLSVTTSASGSPLIYNLSGIGANSGVELSSAALAFPAQNVNTSSAAKNLRVTNTGSSALSILSVSASGDYSQTNTCGSSLAVGANCVVTVKFTPSAAGLRKGHITISDTDPSKLQNVNLSGQGQVPASTVSVSPVEPSVTFSQTQQFTATVNGVTSTDVTWSVDGVVGGNSKAGTIDAAGLYTPPAVAGTHQITATSSAEQSQTATVPLVVTNYAGTFTYHNDLARTGQNLTETVLTTGNVNAAQFGKVFSYPVDGQIYAQPLYVANVAIPNQGNHNVVYVATEHDSVYAFDADGRTTTPLWQNSYANGTTATTVPSSLFTCGSLQPEVGITGTPVIDQVHGVLYVVVRTAEVSGGVTNYIQRLHSLDITSGAELNTPAVIQPTVPGSGYGNDQNGNIPFDGLKENQRAGLVLLNGSLYIAWGGLCDNNPYHGWLVQYDPTTLQQGAAFNTSPNDWGSPLWDSGSAPAADAEGNLYALTGNGDFDLTFGGGEMGDSFIKISTAGGLSLADYFTPYDQSILFHWDLDLGSGGLMVLPDQPTAPTHLVIGGGKEGTIYLINRDAMGEYNSSTYDDSQVVQTLVHAAGQLSSYETSVAGLWSTPAYFNNQVYYVGTSDVPKAFRLWDSQLSPIPVSQGAQLFKYPGGEIAISANGSSNAIMWTIAEPLIAPKYAVLYAYDAANLSNLLYSSSSSGTRDLGGLGVQFGQPTVANGKVYIGTKTELDVFGLLP
jgi:hypothetical protein